LKFIPNLGGARAKLSAATLSIDAKFALRVFAVVVEIISTTFGSFLAVSCTYLGIRESTQPSPCRYFARTCRVRTRYERIPNEWPDETGSPSLLQQENGWRKLDWWSVCQDIGGNITHRRKICTARIRGSRRDNLYYAWLVLGR
jgi:hypothetical protein